MSQIDIAIYNIDLCSFLVCTLISKYNSSSSLRYSAQAAMEDPAIYRRSKILLDTPPQGLNGMPINVDRCRMKVRLSTPWVRMSVWDWLVNSMFSVGSRWWTVDCHWARLVRRVVLAFCRACNTDVGLLI